MEYYRYKNAVLCGEGTIPGEKLAAPPTEGEILYFFRREPLMGRETFAVTDSALLTAEEGVRTLDADTAPLPLPEGLGQALRQGRIRAINGAHPRWEELLTPVFPVCAPDRKVRVHLLALGDVGSTLLVGLRLLGGDVISSIGICDVREGVSERWEFELNQIHTLTYGALPPVSIVNTADLFQCDVFLFCASRYVPDTAVKTGDVRMAQYEKNRELAVMYARMAREAHFQGLFCVVSDPVDPLCRAVLRASNQNAIGTQDGLGLFPHQVKGFGLGVMNARAVYYAQKDARFRQFLTEGRVFGPHGEGLVVADSIAHYNDTLSRILTDRVTHANLKMRALGFKPYVAPALSSGALSLLALLRGEWHCSSVYLNKVFFGVRNRLTPHGPAVERLPLPEALSQRLQETMAQLANLPE